MLNGIVAPFHRTFQANSLVYLTGAVVLLCSTIAATWLDRSLSFHTILFFAWSLLQFSGVIFGGLVAMKLVQLRRSGFDGSPTKAIGVWMLDGMIGGDRFAHFIHAFLGVSMMLVGFSFLKDSVPLINPFGWDEAFFKLDRALHFGVDPWLLLHGVMGYPLVTLVVNVAYNFWFVIMFSALLWICCDTRDRVLRTQFLLAFMLTWFLGGNVLASVFSSAGPVFYAPLGLEGDPFGGLMDYLNSANRIYPVWALDIQNQLWETYSTGSEGISGISAMPSMHVATSVLFALLGFRFSTRLGWALTVFAVVIMAGSVHLAWHYAVDGYFGAVLALVIWKACGALARWDVRRV